MQRLVLILQNHIWGRGFGDIRTRFEGWARSWHLGEKSGRSGHYSPIEMPDTGARLAPNLQEGLIGGLPLAQGFSGRFGDGGEYSEAGLYVPDMDSTCDTSRTGVCRMSEYQG
jgi:hypothetical protein